MRNKFLCQIEASPLCIKQLISTLIDPDPDIEGNLFREINTWKTIELDHISCYNLTYMVRKT